MKHQEGNLKSIRNTSIYYQCWLPEGKPNAVLLIIHGLAEHSGRYMNLVNHFVPLGYAVYGIDHPGHGKSEGPRVYVEQFADFTDTIKIYFEMIRRWQPDKPIFLVGHSLGGLIGAFYLLDHQTGLTGAVLSGPSVKIPDNITPAIIQIGKVLSTLLPKFRLVPLEAKAVSSDPAVVQAYINDPLVYTGKTTARLAAEILKAMQRVMKQAGQITLPVLIVQGGADRIVSPDGARILYDAIQSQDKTIKVYDGFYHEVYNEPGREQVLHDVEMWLEMHRTGKKV